MLLAASLNRSRMSVHGINCTDYLDRQIYLASRGEKRVWVVLTAQFAPLRRCTSLISPTGGRASRLRCAKGLKIRNPFYERGERLYNDGPPPSKSASRHTFRRDRAHPSSAGDKTPSCSKRVDPTTRHWMKKLVLDPELSRWFKILSTRKR